MADAPHPPGPAEEGQPRQPRRGSTEDSLLVGGLVGILSVTLATLGLAVAAAAIALVVSLVF